MYNLKKSLISTALCVVSSLNIFVCSGLKRNDKGIITELSKDVSTQEKIAEAKSAYSEYIERLNEYPELLEMLLYNVFGSVVSLDPENTNLDTTYYDEICNGNFGLKWVLVHYIGKLLNDAGIKTNLWCFYKKTSIGDLSKIIYHYLVYYNDTDETFQTFDFVMPDNSVFKEDIVEVFDTTINKIRTDEYDTELHNCLITMTFTDPVTGKLVKMPPTLKRHFNELRAYDGMPNIAHLPKKVAYLSTSRKIKSI